MVNNEYETPPGCGVTDGNTLESQIGYVRDMQEMQDALQIVINNVQDKARVLANPGVIQAIEEEWAISLHMRLRTNS